MRKTFLFILALCAASVAWGEMTTGPVTYASIAKQNNWAKNSYNQTLDWGGAISVTAKWDGSTKNGKSIDNTSWRIYQKSLKGEFTITAKPGFTIKTIKLTYATNNKGVCSKTANESPSTTATDAADQIKSGTVYEVNASSITLYVGVTEATTESGDITISLQTIEVTYDYDFADSYLTEKFQIPDGTDWNFGTSTSGTTTDGKYYTWEHGNIRYNNQAMDVLQNGAKAVEMRNAPNAYFQTVAEGGVKYISFCWNQAAADESSYPAEKLILSVGDESETQTIVGQAAANRCGDRLFSFFPVTSGKTNATIKLSNLDAYRIIFGPITIVPYLRYTYTETKQVYDDESTFDCSLQIDNTDGEGAITYSSDNTDAVSFADPANPEATIVGGGEATITATWSEASTSFKLKVNVLPVPTVTFPGITDGKKSVALDVESFTEAAEVDMEVPIVYSSSNENVATVNEDGKVTVLTTGTTEITAKVEAKKGEYKEASATYTLTVTASEVSEVSFVEKYGNTATWDSYSDDKKIIGTDNIFYWVANNTRRKSDDKIGSNVGLRFGGSLEGSYHFQSDPEYNDGIMEGGIKRIAFTYKEANNGSGVNFEISANSVKRVIKTEPNSGKELPFAANFFVKENTSLKMFNTNGASVVTIGPISIVPYLLFTTKSDEAFLSLVDEYDIKNVLIDNTDDGEVVYSILTEGAKSLISNDGVVTFDEVTESETITIQAAWTPDGESSATVITTMTLYVDVESKTDKTVEEEFSNYGETGWASSEANEVTKNGDVYDWRTQLTRHKNSDKLVDNQQAIWFAQGGYVATADAIDNTKVGPAEGGIKRIAFDWNQNAGDQTGDDLYISVSVDGTEISAIRRDGGAQPTEEPWQYIHNLNVKKNATLKIENKSTTSEKEGGRVKIGTIVITPYLLYTKKELSAKLGDKTAINVDICNNTIGGAITYSSLNPEVASLAGDDQQHPDKLKLNSVGDAVIVATWTPDGSEEVVTTSYTLHVTEKADRGLYFQEAVKETTVGGSDITNTLNGTLDATEQTWSTASNGVVTSVSTEGLVSPIAIGTDTVTVVVAESDAYQEGTASYQVIVRSGVADDKKLVEGFSNITTTSTAAAKWEGDLKDYFSWNVVNARRSTDKIAGEVGVWMSAKGSIATNDVIEGGIKYFTFNWMQPSVEKGATLRLNLVAGEKNYHQDYVVTTDNGGSTNEIFYFAGDMQVKKNVQLTLTNESFKTDGGAALTENGRIILDKFEIVPYLFYKTKSHTIENATVGDTYTNDDLINNIDNNEGTITYCLIGEGADDIASINASTGEVTVNAGGVVTVQAKWVPEGAGEDEFVTTTYELTINFPQPTITFNDFDVDLDGTVTPDIMVKLDEEDITETATISYEVADENIATWDATNGWKLKTHGTTQVTAKVERTAQYGAASATATMTVNTMTFAEGTFFTENFGGEATGSYSTKTENWRGKDNVYPWTFLNWRRYADHVRITMTKPESSNINGYIYMNPFDGGALEGGIKAVQVTWSAPGASSLATDFYVDDMNNSGATKVAIQKEAGTISGQQITQAIFNSKTNAAQLRIRIGSLDKSAIDVYSVDIVPYLLYTTKVVEKTYVKDGTNTVDASANLINNLEVGETVTYSLSAGAQATIDGSTITLANATEDVIVTATCGEVSTTFTLKVTKAEDPDPEPNFVLENKTAGALATICLPKKIAKVENATLYSISYGNTQMIEFVEADLENDAAGMPYLVQVAADGKVNFYYGEGDAVDAPVSVEDANGFVGSLQEENQEVPSDGTAILVSGGQLRIAGTNCVLIKNHAYISTTCLPETATPSSAPRRTIRLYNPDAAPTGLGQWNKDKGQRTMKVIENGQFRIVRDGKTYNAQGILVE